MSERKPYTSEKYLLIVAILLIFLVTFGGVYYFAMINASVDKGIQHKRSRSPVTAKKMSAKQSSSGSTCLFGENSGANTPNQTSIPSITDFIKYIEGLTVIYTFDHPSLDVIDQYIQKGLSIDTFDDTTGFTPLSLAASQWMTPVLKRMNDLSGIDFKKQNPAGYTIMHQVVTGHPNTNYERYRMRETLKYLISIGGDVDALNRENWTPLMVAIKADNIYAVNILLRDFNANPNTPSRPYAPSPLMIAVEGENMKIVLLLVKYGAERTLSSPTNEIVTISKFNDSESESDSEFYEFLDPELVE